MRLGGKGEESLSWDGNAIRSLLPSKVAKLDIALAPSSEISRDERRCSGKGESEEGAVVKVALCNGFLGLLDLGR